MAGGNSCPASGYIATRWVSARKIFWYTGLATASQSRTPETSKLLSCNGALMKSGRGASATRPGSRRKLIGVVVILLLDQWHIPFAPPALQIAVVIFAGFRKAAACDHCSDPFIKGRHKQRVVPAKRMPNRADATFVYHRQRLQHIHRTPMVDNAFHRATKVVMFVGIKRIFAQIGWLGTMIRQPRSANSSAYVDWIPSNQSARLSRF